MGGRSEASRFLQSLIMRRLKRLQKPPILFHESRIFLIPKGFRVVGSCINQLADWQLISLAFLVSLLVNVGIVWAVAVFIK